MRAPSLTTIVCCMGRESLRRTIESYVAQDRAEDDRLLLVMNDQEHPDGVTRARRYIAEVGDGSVELHLSVERGFYNRLNWASFQIPIATTHVLPMMGDDDIFVGHAFRTLRAACVEDLERIVLCRFLSPFRFVLWDEPRMQISRISGQCVAVPAHYWPMPFSTRDYLEVDYDWMCALLARQHVERGIEPRWLDAVLVIARPDGATEAQGWHDWAPGREANTPALHLRQQLYRQQQDAKVCGGRT